MSTNPYIEVNPVAWYTIANKVYQLTRETVTDTATYRITVKAIDQNDKGAGTKANGYFFKDFLGHTYKIIAYTSTTIDVEDSFKIQFAPTSGKVGIVYKSVYNNDSPYLAPVFYKRLSKQAIEYSRQFELNILWNRNYFNGSCQITSLTDNGDGTVTIGEGKYCLNTETDGSGSTAEYTLEGDTFTLTDLAQNYIVADYNSGSPLVKLISDVTLINETTIVPVYTIFRNGVYLHTQNWDALGHSLANKVHQSIVKTQRYRRESGLAISESGTHNLSLTGGRVWTGAVPITLDAINTATDNLFLWYHSSGNWTSSVQATYDYTQYDNGTDLVTLTANRYAVNWIFRGVESQKHLYIVLGTGDYTLAQAQAAKVPSLPIAISSHAVLVGKLVIQKSAATALTVESAFDVQFSASALSGGASPPATISSSTTNTDTGSEHTHELATSGVTSGSYSFATITVNNKGIITSASNGVTSGFALGGWFSISRTTEYTGTSAVTVGFSSETHKNFIFNFSLRDTSGGLLAKGLYAGYYSNNATPKGELNSIITFSSSYVTNIELINSGSNLVLQFTFDAMPANYLIRGHFTKDG